MIEVSELAEIIRQRYEEDSNDPTPTQLATFIVARYFERLCGMANSDDALLLKAALKVVDRTLSCDTRVTISRGPSGVRLHDSESGIHCEASTVSRVLVDFAAQASEPL